MVSGAVHQSERNSRVPWSIILWVCFCFCTCTYLFTSPWYSQEQSVVLRDSLSSVSSYLWCLFRPSWPPSRPLSVISKPLLSALQQLSQVLGPFPCAHEVLSWCESWNGLNPRAFYQTLPPCFLHPSLVTVYLCVLEGVELSFFCPYFPKLHIYEKKVSLCFCLSALALAGCWAIHRLQRQRQTFPYENTPESWCISVTPTRLTKLLRGLIYWITLSNYYSRLSW